MFRVGYNTNGLAHHRLDEALQLLHDLGYRGVAVTPDVGALDPYRLDAREVERVRSLARELDLVLTVETGARFLLDPARKHFPTLLEESEGDRARRVDFLRRSIDLAADLGAGVVSFWAGCAPGGVVGDSGDRGGAVEAVWDRLVAGVVAVLDHGRERGVRLAFEPEPGMFLERPSGYLALCERLGERGDELGLCLDVGHLLCTGDLPVGNVIRELGPRLAQVHLDDIRGGEHVHRMFGEGELDLAETLAALRDVRYAGLAAVELSRDAHRGAAAAREAMEHLRAAGGSRGE